MATGITIAFGTAELPGGHKMTLVNFNVLYYAHLTLTLTVNGVGEAFNSIRIVNGSFFRLVSILDPKFFDTITSFFDHFTYIET